MRFYNGSVNLVSNASYLEEVPVGQDSWDNVDEAILALTDGSPVFAELLFMPVKPWLTARKKQIFIKGNPGHALMNSYTKRACKRSYKICA